MKKWPVSSPATHRTEIESLERAIKRQDELYAEQQRRYEEENQKYQSELQNLRPQAEEAQRYYALVNQPSSSPSKTKRHF
jgi:hypothetical protein